MLQGLLDSLRAQIASQIVTGALVLGLVAVAAATFRKLPAFAWSHIKRLFIVTAVIDSRNDLFQSYLAWLNESRFGRASRLFTVIQQEPGPGAEAAVPAVAVGAVGAADPVQASAMRLAYTPAPGLHFFFHRGHLMWIERDIAMNLQVIETLKISALFARRRALERMLEDVLKAADARHADRTVLYTMDRWGDNWTLSGAKPRRSLASVVLARDDEARLRADIEQFFSRRRWYADLGIPWRRGYLFHGPPGTGKTSLAFAMAGELRLNLCTLSLANPKLNDQNIADLLQRTPPRSLILIEDVDAFYAAREKQDARIEVSFSGLLNALDGVGAQEGRIVVLTTNRREALDAALVRPGRIDLALALGNASRQQIEALFLRFHPTETMLAREVAAALPDEALSPATIQQALLAHPRAADAARALHELVVIENRRET